jgi:Fe-S cluster assembly ATPase SufC
MKNLKIETILIIISGKEKYRMKKGTILLAIIAFFSLSVS